MSQQEQINKTMVDEGKLRFWREFNRAVREGREYSTAVYRSIAFHLFRKYEARLTEGIKEADSGEPGRKYRAIPFLENLDPAVVTAIVFKCVINGLNKKRRYTQLCIKIGNNIDAELLYLYIKNNHKGLFKKLERQTKKSNSDEHKKTVFVYAANKLGLDIPRLSTRNKTLIGAYLVYIMEELGVVQTLNVRTNKKQARVITATKHTEEWVKSVAKHFEFADPYYLPYVVQPSDWHHDGSDIIGGCYKDHEGPVAPVVPFIKSRDPFYLSSVMPFLKIPNVLKAVNNLQKTAWVVNSKVYDKVAEINLNPEKYQEAFSLVQEPLPERPEDIDTNDKSLKDWKTKARLVYEHNVRQTSKSIRFYITKSLAKRYKKQAAIFFPHNTDFRGRIYPVSPGLSPQSDDMSKGLLQFRDSCVIEEGSRSAFWFKVYGVGMLGHKGTYDERVEFFDSHHEMMIEKLESTDWTKDIAGAPNDYVLRMYAWLLEAETFIKEGSVSSHTPIHVDGSNNGLQLLSLLSRDPSTALLTNCSDDNNFNDIYQTVADRTLEVLKERGTLIDNFWINTGIDRNTVKRPVMILPYSGTLYACIQYIEQWYNKYKKTGLMESTPRSYMSYLAGIVWQSIKEVVGKPMEVMSWMRTCTDMVLKSGNVPTWTTPTGFVVRQFYPDMKTMSVRTCLGDSCRRMSIKEPTLKQSRSSHKNGIVPNFIHSLDASLAQIVISEYLHDIPLSFNHDSFGSLACNVDLLNSSIRDAAIDMFSDNLLEYLREELQVLSDEPLPAVPELGAFDINKLKDAKYFFSCG